MPRQSRLHRALGRSEKVADSGECPAGRNRTYQAVRREAVAGRIPDAERPDRAVEPEQAILVGTSTCNEVADARKAPARIDGTDKDVLVEACAGRLPFRERISVLPDKVALAVAIEVAEAGQRPNSLNLPTPLLD